MTKKNILLPAILLLIFVEARSQTSHPLTRMARLVIDSSQLVTYKKMLQEEIQTSLQLEAGVWTLYAAWEKDRPTHFSILEVYADSAAYLAHLKTPHFMRYKTSTQNMVQSLELVSVIPLIEIKKRKP